MDRLAPRPTLIALRQAEPVTDNDNYWPQGFADELISELVSVIEADPDAEFEFARFEEMSSRAAVELTADLIADPRNGQNTWPPLSNSAGRHWADPTGH